MRRRLLVVIWGCSVLIAVINESFLADAMRGLSIDSLVWLRDHFPDHARSTEDSSIAIIAVDEKTYQTPPFQGTPRVAWSDHFARVIDALIDADVAAIGFDIVLPTSLESRFPGIDRELLKSLHRGSREGRIVLGEILHGQERIEPFPGYRAVVGFEKNIRPLDVIVDPDGVVRRMPLSLPTNSLDGASGRMRSMALELSHRFHKPIEDSVNGQIKEKSSDSGFLNHLFDQQIDGSIINLRRDNIDVPTYSLADLYQCAGLQGHQYFSTHFANKIVLIGSALDVEDQVLSSARFILPGLNRQSIDGCSSLNANSKTAGSNRPTMPGVYLHAAMVQNLLDDDLVSTLSPSAHMILTMLAAGFLMMASVTLQPVASLSLLGIVNAIITTIASLAFTFDLLIFFLVPVTGTVLGYAGGLSLHLLILERRRRRIRDAFNHLLPTSVVEQLIDRNEFPKGGGKLVVCTVLLTDLENYSGLAEQLKPDKLVDLLNKINQVLGEQIERHGGIVSWHAGDSLLALFGAPIECDAHPAQAVRAALACCTAVDSLSTPELAMRELTLRVRIGVSTGEVLVGYVGSDRQLTYSAIGDHVNIASRLEGLNKIYGTSVLVNETTQSLTKHDFKWRKVDTTIVKGRKSSISIFEPQKPEINILR